MARPRKKASDLTSDEALRKLFPKPVRDQAKKEAKKAEKKESRNPSTHEG
jgi:hypothetical protein